MNTPNTDLITTNLPDDYSCRSGNISTREAFLTDQPKASVDFMKTVTDAGLYHRVVKDYLLGRLTDAGKEACYSLILQLRLWRADCHD